VSRLSTQIEDFKATIEKLNQELGDSRHEAEKEAITSEHLRQQLEQAGTRIEAGEQELGNSKMKVETLSTHLDELGKENVQFKVLN